MRILVLIICLVTPVPALAQAGTEVDVELVLAVDVSRSMTPHELEIQRRGYAEALASPEVAAAIRRGEIGQIAVTYLEWAGTGSHEVIVGWTLIRSAADARAFADRLTARFDENMRRTSIAGAIDFSATLFAGNGFRSYRQVIDISGDGPNNEGRPVERARDEAVAHGITINGLPLMTREGMGAQWHLDDLDLYYRDCVIGGPGAFMIPVTEWDHFPRAVTRKLVLDLVQHEGLPDWAIIPADSPRPYDCLIGEKIWEDLQGDWN